MKKIIAGLIGVSIFLTSCATVQTKIGEVAMKFMTTKEKDLSKISAIGMYQSNMYSTETGITLGSKAEWDEGQNSVGVQLLKPDGAVGFINLDGTVTVGGQTATNFGGGVYMVMFEASDNSPKTVKVESSDGTVTEFKMTPAPSLRIKSINGTLDDAEIDMTQPLEIELEYDEAAKGKRVRVALITKAVGVKGFAFFQSAQIAEKITIHPDAFKHKHINGGSPTGKDVTNWSLGDNYLQVSIVEDDRTNDGQPFSYFKRTSTSFDTKPVTLSGEVEGRSYITAKDKIDAPNGTFSYLVNASNAWYARPLNTNIERIGIASVSVEGVLYKQESDSKTSETDYGAYKVISTTTTTTTWQFPQLDDTYWDQFLENIYADLTGMLRDEYGASVVDVDKITANPIYDEFYLPNDANTEKYISKNLRDTKRLYPSSFGEILGDRKTSLIADADPMPRLLRDMDLDAIMTLAIDYRVAADKDDKIVLLPLVSYKVVGQTQAFDGQANTWLQGTIEGPGVSFSREEFSDLNALNRIGQKDRILDLIRQSVDEMTSRQDEFGYDHVWEVALSN
ncbi:MAG TPA: hypothetical protein DEQ34_11835 [Balneolaceae bacterium]|nr:hypothetical protein [Balneolaceae bacterium]|tara:strand:+ start:54197 stop:55888 length:1692 start_codon:yes stop_codon:yes gene_type:complete